MNTKLIIILDKENDELNKRQFSNIFFNDYKKIEYLFTSPKVNTFKIFNDKVLEVLDDNNYLIITSSIPFYKYLTKVKKVSPTIGNILDVIINNKNQKVIYIPSVDNYFNEFEFHNSKTNLILNQIEDYIQGIYKPIGLNIIKSAVYPDTIEEIEEILNNLISSDINLTADIETYSLKFYNAGIGTIAFGLSDNSGIAFNVDLNNSKETSNKIRLLLKDFFIRFPNKIIWHNASYDVTVLIYNLFMDNKLGNYEGLLEGLEVFTRNIEDTKLIAYTCLNSCGKVSLSLKDLAQEYVGNYAIEEIKDITKVDNNKLLTYNLVDCLATSYIYKKYKPVLKEYDDKEFYKNILKPALKDIIHTQLTGLPVNKERLESVNKELIDKRNTFINNIKKHPIIYSFEKDVKIKTADVYNASHVKKIKLWQDIDFTFNINSGPQLSKILYDKEYLGLPILKYTEKKSPSVDGDTIEKLSKLDNIKDIDKELLVNIKDYIDIEKIINSFTLPWLEQLQSDDKWNYLYGNFNIGSTVSGRLSSSSPNLNYVGFIPVMVYRKLPKQGNSLIETILC